MYGLNLEITNKCNLNCIHCGVMENCSKKTNNISNELTFEQYRELIYKAKELGCKHIILAGGEPLIRKDFFDICSYINELGISFAILTNGILIDEECAIRFSKYKYLTYVRISFDYYSNEKFSDFRGIQNIRRIVENSIRLLSKYRVKVGIGMVLMNDNLEDVKPIAELSQKLGANFFRAVPVMPIGKAKELMIDTEFYSSALVKVMEVAQDFQPKDFATLFLPDDLKRLEANVALECPGGDKIIAIDAYGYVKRCPITLSKTDESVVEKDFKLLYEEISNKTNLEKQAVMNSLNSSCNKCNDIKSCKGGCLSERELRDTKHSDINPICLKNVWNMAFDKISVTPRLRRLVNNMMCVFNTQNIYKIPMCYRSSPLWWFNLGGKN